MTTIGRVVTVGPSQTLPVLTEPAAADEAAALAQRWRPEQHGAVAGLRGCDSVWAHPPLTTAEEFAAASRHSWRFAAPISDTDDAQPPEQWRAA